MAMYFNGASEIQADGLQTLYLMNPGYVGYSDAQPPENMAFLNSAGNSLTPASLSHIQHQNRQQFHGIPLQPTTVASSSASQHEISALNVHGFVPRVHYNLWRSVDPTTSSASQEQHQIPATESPANNSLGNFDFASQLGLRRSVIQPGQQGLSLSLSPQQSNYGSYQPESDIPAPEISPARGNEMRISGGSGSSVSAISNGISGMQSILLGSKYLKITQELLDEVVNVGKEIKSESSKGIKTEMKISKDSYSATGESSNGGGTGAKPGTELTTAERQELQMKKAKLITMLDEVEQRYRQYHHQMQIVVASFEQAAGFGSAKTYTALALRTISKQFRCLKDAISSQIKATSMNLGEEDCLGGKNHTSRLRLIDHQLRQQRALQQLGMIQHNAWRPQRGLPERSVSVLRAWLFEHFLHPYPKDSDKHMLAKQTGLTRSQVSNWFINARVRLWKPMVEEMYMEEIKDREQNGSEDKTTKNVHNEESGSKSTAPRENSPIRKDPIKNLKSKQDNFTIKNASSIENISSTVTPFTMEGFVEQSPKKQRSNDLNNSPISIPLIMDMEVKPEGEISNKELYAKFGNERQSWDSYSLFAGTENNGRFGAYPIGEIDRFDSEEYTPRLSGNGVALTLGLPHCENLSLAGTQQSYLSNHNIQLGRRLNMGGSERNDFCEINTPPPSHSATGYETINMQNRKRFSAQLLRDFVA